MLLEYLRLSSYSSPHVQASMSVYDIPDLQRAGTNLGSVIFSESFLESSIYIQDKGVCVCVGCKLSQRLWATFGGMNPAFVLLDAKQAPTSDCFEPS